MAQMNVKKSSNRLLPWDTRELVTSKFCDDCWLHGSKLKKNTDYSACKKSYTACTIRQVRAKVKINLQLKLVSGNKFYTTDSLLAHSAVRC